jgi:MFS family permease
MLLITGARMGQTHGYKRLFLIGVALGVAGFGSLYLALAATPGSAHASHAFGLTSLALAVAAALAAVGAYLATHVSDDGGRPNRAAKPRHPGDLITTASQGSKP